MSVLSRRALVGDIGGTNIRLAISDIDELTISDYAQLSTADFDGPHEAIERYLKTVPRKPGLVALAVAGPVRGDTVSMTNRPWRFTGSEIAALTHAEQVVIVNDFEAVALAVPHLSRYDLVRVGDGDAKAAGNKAVLGPGTGLGVAGALRSGDDWTAVASEGGHVGFGAETDAEAKLLRKIQGTAPFLAAEDVLSGRGLVALHKALGGRARQDARVSPESIVKAALVDREPVAIATLDQFIAWLGRFAGDVGLMFGAQGGVYIAGGIAPNIARQLQTGGLRAAFERKGPLSDYLKRVPLYVVKAGADAGLRGAAIALSQQRPTPTVRTKRLQSAG